MKKIMISVLTFVCVCSLSACNNGNIEVTKEAFPEFEGRSFTGDIVNNDIFGDYDATIINFWSNGCGSCIEEMPDLEAYYQDFKEKNINLMAVAASAGDSEEMRSEAETILKEKSVTYTNIIPDTESGFYKEFISKITGYPITYVVDGDGNIIGAPIVGVVKNQEEKLLKRLEMITK